jgi:cyclophilin family peptidyl-prolyl cis-trans isomerase
LSGNSIQGGTIGNPNGKSGTSLFVNSSPFAPDNYNVCHTRAGLISAVRANTNSNINLRFFVQIKDNTGWADGRYTAFGVVLDDGKRGNRKVDLVRRISRVEVKTPQNSPKEPITIVGCRMLPGAET